MKPFKGEQEDAYTTEIREKVKQLGEFIKSVATDYRSTHNLPISDDGRIIPALREDTGIATEGLRRWHGDVADETAVRKDSAQENGRLEMLAYAVFWKNLREKFVVARASRHDSHINKTHTVLLEKETGALVCAFDEVGETAGFDYENKLEAIRKQNVQEGGTSLKYGLRVEAKDDKKTIVSGTVTNVPLFYIALPQDRVDKGIKEFVPSPTNQSDFEKKLFEYFIATILAQIRGLELYSGRLDNDLKKKLQGFKHAITIGKFGTETTGA